MTTTEAKRALPTTDQMQEHFPGDPLSYDLAMEHGAISPDGKSISVGHQHYVLDVTSLKIIGTVGPMSEYTQC